MAGRLRPGKQRLERQLEILARTPALLQSTTMTLTAWAQQVQGQA